MIKKMYPFNKIAPADDPLLSQDIFSTQQSGSQYQTQQNFYQSQACFKSQIQCSFFEPSNSRTDLLIKDDKDAYESFVLPESQVSMQQGSSERVVVDERNTFDDSESDHSMGNDLDENDPFDDDLSQGIFESQQLNKSEVEELSHLEDSGNQTQSQVLSLQTVADANGDERRIFQTQQQENLLKVQVFDTTETTDIPRSIAKLFNTIGQREWSFLWILASDLCSKELPMGAYSNLKQSLLLSLASIDGKSLPIHIIGIGNETSHASLLMNVTGKLASRFIKPTGSSFDGSFVDKDGVTEAGPLLMAAGGVCYVGDWRRLTPKGVLKLLREIETGLVTTEKAQQSVKLECSIWAYWSCFQNIKQDIKNVNQFMK